MSDFIDNIKQIPITDYAERLGFTLVSKGRRYVSLKEHDSVMIDTEKNAYWQNSEFQIGRKGGAGSVIDFCMAFTGRDMKEALRELSTIYGIEGDKAATVPFNKPTYAEPERPKREAGDIELPPRGSNNDSAIRYLTQERKISPTVVNDFISRGMLYQDVRRNCVFHTDRFGCLRSTGGKKFAIDLRGNDYNECFFIRPQNAAPQNNTIVVSEAVIDTMSMMTFLESRGRSYSDYTYLALTGTNKMFALFNHLDKNPQLNQVILALDNDKAGRDAVEAAVEELNKRGIKHIVYYPPSGKDWNEYIQSDAFQKSNVTVEKQTEPAKENADNQLQSPVIQEHESKNLDEIEAVFIGNSESDREIALKLYSISPDSVYVGKVSFTAPPLERVATIEDIRSGEMIGATALFADAKIWKEMFELNARETNYIATPPTITCNWSEHDELEAGKNYSVLEFDRLMKRLDSEWDREGYAKTSFTVNVPNIGKFTERQDIGDGDGGVIQFLGQFDRFKELAALLSEVAFQQQRVVDEIAKNVWTNDKPAWYRQIDEIRDRFTVHEVVSELQERDNGNRDELSESAFDNYSSKALRVSYLAMNHTTNELNTALKDMEENMSTSAEFGNSEFVISCNLKEVELAYKYAEELRVLRESAMQQISHIFDTSQMNIEDEVPPLPPEYQEDNIPPPPPEYQEDNIPPPPPEYQEDNIPPPPPEYQEDNIPPPPPEYQEDNIPPPPSEYTGTLPDSKITIEERNAYGYESNELLPLTEEKALEFFDNDISVYLLYEDGTESKANERSDIENHHGIFGIETVEWERYQAEREKATLLVENEHNAASVTTKETVDKEKLTGKERLALELTEGIQKVMESDQFKNWLATSGKTYTQQYSFQNAILVWLQRPDASYTMSYESWKDYGRQVQQGAKGIQIYAPQMAYESAKGALFRKIKAELTSELAKNPEAAQVSYRLGNSSFEFTMNRNHLIGFKVKGKEQGLFNDDEQVKRFIERSIIGKMPVGFKAVTVFDVKDTEVPTHLWVKASKAMKHEIVLDSKGNPTTNSRGEVKIVNSPERQAKFQTTLMSSAEVSKLDDEKLLKLFDACAAASIRKGVPVYLRDKMQDDTLENAHGYFSRETSQEHPKGYIVIDESLSPVKRVATLFHEMGHADLHGNLKELAAAMGEKRIPQSMREIQAEAVAYSTAAQFGIETSTNSFSYLSAYANGFEIQDLQKSLSVIHKEMKSLTADIKAELDIRGLTMEITPKETALLDAETIQTLGRRYMELVKKEEEKASSEKAEFPDLIKAYRTNIEVVGVLRNHKENCDARLGNVDTILQAIDSLSKAESREEQDGLISVMESAAARISKLNLSFDELSDEFVRLTSQIDKSLKAEFAKNPMDVLNKLQKQYPELAELSDAQKSYICKSKYVAKEYSPLLRNEPQAFVDAVCERAKRIPELASQNGTFVESVKCESWTEQTIFEAGTICHPKIAEMIFQSGEAQMQALKRDAAAHGEYVPNVKCQVSIFTPINGKLCCQTTSIEVGCNKQRGLLEHLQNTQGKHKGKQQVVLNVTDSLNEKAPYADKIMSSHRDSSSGSEHTASISGVRMTKGEWENTVNVQRPADREPSEKGSGVRSKHEMNKG